MVQVGRRTTHPRPCELCIARQLPGHVAYVSPRKAPHFPHGPSACFASCRAGDAPAMETVVVEIVANHGKPGTPAFTAADAQCFVATPKQLKNCSASELENLCLQADMPT